MEKERDNVQHEQAAYVLAVASTCFEFWIPGTFDFYIFLGFSSILTSAFDFQKSHRAPNAQKSSIDIIENIFQLH